MKVLNFSNDKLLCATNKWLLFWHRNKIIVCNNDDEKTFFFHKKMISNPLLSFSLVQRLFRIEPRSAIAINDDNVIFSFNGATYFLDIPNSNMVIEQIFQKGMRNPLHYCIGENVDGSIAVLYGEYIWNGNHDAVSVYRRNNKGEWEIVYEFPKNSITHIHNIIYDKDNKTYYIMSGDSNNESGIWKANIDFSNVEPILLGSQQYRSCVGARFNRSFVYTTDTPLETNHILQFDFNNPKAVELSEICGPVIYGIFFKDSLYFSTSVEPDSTLNKLRYRLTSRLGKGVKDRYSRVYSYNPIEGLKEVCRFKKDSLPMWLFQFGNICFPYSTDGKLYITTQSVKAKSRTMVVTE